MHVVAYAGSHADMGRAHGELLARQVAQNLASFWGLAQSQGYDPQELQRRALRQENLLSPPRLEEIEGIAKGARQAYPELLAYNLFKDRLLPEECTVMMALKGGSASGQTVFFKNSDKVGGESLVGPNFHRFKEINVVLALAPNGGNKIVGPAAAGSTGLKMGLNDKGVATGSNIARTEELMNRKVDLTQIRALDRGQLMREGLEHNTALEAATYVAGRIAANPMDTPGNVEFADAQEAIIIEGSYDRLALEKVQEGVAARTNMFILLRELNWWRDLSSQCRYVRSLELLNEHQGKITPELMIRFAVDHSNGPGPNSICRHGAHPSEEVSLSSMVMEIDGRDPTRSRFAVALGKPCHAWREKHGHLWLDMTFDPEKLPSGFVDGSVWKELYNEEAREE